MSKTWTVSVDSSGDISFPEDLVKTMDWEEGTILMWDIQDDGAISFALCRQATQIQLALRECLEVVPFSID